MNKTIMERGGGLNQEPSFEPSYDLRSWDRGGGRHRSIGNPFQKNGHILQPAVGSKTPDSVEVIAGAHHCRDGTAARSEEVKDKRN